MGERTGSDRMSEQVGEFTISLERSDAIRLSGYGVLLLFLAVAVFSVLVGADDAPPADGLLLLAAYLLTLVLHEAVHGFFFLAFGGRPTFGVGRIFILPYAYASAPGYSYSLRQMLIIALAPLVLLSLGSLALAASLSVLAPYMVVVFVGNFAGSVGDLWIAARLIAFRRVDDLRIVDERSGVRVAGSGPAFDRAVSRSAPADGRARSGFLLHWMGASLVIALLTGALSVMLPVLLDEAHIIIGPQAFPLFEYSSRPGEGFEVTFNLLPALAGGFVYAAILTTLRWSITRRRGRR